MKVCAVKGRHAIFKKSMARILITFGGWSGHFPKETSQLIGNWMESRGHSVQLTENFDLWRPDTLGEFDLVVPNWTMGEVPPEAVQALKSAVLAGMGLAGYHGGMGDACRANTDFQYMVGGQFVAHPGDKKRYQVQIVNPTHPIVEGLEDFEVKSEQYYMHVDPGNEVLATTVFDGVPDPWIKGTVMPVAWTRRFGAGKVFYCSVGHEPADLQNPPVREMLVRGMEWAAR